MDPKSEALERLEYMAGPESHEKWDLSDNDKAAIRWALSQIDSARAENALMYTEIMKWTNRGAYPKRAFTDEEVNQRIGDFKKSISSAAGTKLLERLRKLEAVAEEVSHIDREMTDCGRCMVIYDKLRESRDEK